MIMNVNGGPPSHFHKKYDRYGSDETNFNTPLTPEEERDFQKWRMSLPIALQSDYDYDLRGAYINGYGPDENQHMTDLFKKPNHPTFSNESYYSTPEHPGGTWDGDIFIPTGAQIKKMMESAKNNTPSKMIDYNIMPVDKTRADTKYTNIYDDNKAVSNLKSQGGPLQSRTFGYNPYNANLTYPWMRQYARGGKLPEMYQSYGKYKKLRKKNPYFTQEFKDKSEWKAARDIYIDNARSVLHSLNDFNRKAPLFSEEHPYTLSEVNVKPNEEFLAELYGRPSMYMFPQGPEYWKEIYDRYQKIAPEYDYDRFIKNQMSQGVPEEDADEKYWDIETPGWREARAYNQYIMEHPEKIIAPNVRGEQGIEMVSPLLGTYLKYINPLSSAVYWTGKGLLEDGLNGGISNLAMAVIPGVYGRGKFLRAAEDGLGYTGAVANATESVGENVARATTEVASNNGQNTIKWLFNKFNDAGDNALENFYTRIGGDIYQSRNRLFTEGKKSDVFIPKGALDGTELRYYGREVSGKDKQFKKSLKSGVLPQGAKPENYYRVPTESLLTKKTNLMSGLYTGIGPELPLMTESEYANQFGWLNDVLNTQLKVKGHSHPIYYNPITQQTYNSYLKNGFRLGLGTAATGVAAGLGIKLGVDKYNKNKYTKERNIDYDFLYE